MTVAPVLAGVIGHPIGQSLSPLIHTLWAHRAEINGHYIPIDVPPDEESFRSVMRSLQTLGFAGVNVTAPHKEYALNSADIVSELAREIGAANMLTFRDGMIMADNSDVAGFSRSIDPFVTGRTDRPCLVLGAGGAARAILKALKQLDFQNIWISNRTLETAGQLATEFDVAVIEWSQRNEKIPEVSTLVNTTSLGMTGSAPLDLDYTKLSADMLCSDIVYSPLKTPLIQHAQAAGATAIGGLEMLMHQAGPGFEKWFGGTAQVDDELRGQLVRTLERRGTA